MNQRIVGLFIAAFAFVLPGQAQASEMQATIVAHVDVACRIEAQPADSIVIRDGQAAIGPVQEMCNTPSGYQVRSSFTNLAAGQLVVDGVRYPLIDGWAVRSTGHPAALLQGWSLVDATLVNSAQPVLMQILITPL